MVSITGNKFNFLGLDDMLKPVAMTPNPFSLPRIECWLVRICFLTLEKICCKPLVDFNIVAVFWEITLKRGIIPRR